MPELMEIYTHSQAGDSLRQMSKNPGVDRATLRHYITAATAAGIEQGPPLRSGLPEALRVALDGVVRADLQAALALNIFIRGLSQCTEPWGFEHAVRALEEAVTVGRIQTADIVALTQRMALAPTDLASHAVDLRQFDVLLRGRAPQ